MAPDHVCFILLGFLATLVSAVFGLGTALITLSLGPWILPVKSVIALSAVLFAAATLTKSILFHHVIPWRAIIGVSLVSLPFAWLGGLCVGALPADLLRRLLGLMVLGSLAVSRFRVGPRARPHRWLLGVGAAIYGFVSGLLGSGNLVKAILLRPMALGQAGFVGTMAATSVLANGGKLAAYAQAGLLPATHWPTMLGLVAAALLAAIIGKACLHRLAIHWFEAGLRSVIALSALLLLL